MNSLLVLAVLNHEFHSRVATWVERLAAKGIPELATCSITELGFVCVLDRSSVTQARELLLQLKNSEGITCAFIPGFNEIRYLPKWVKSPSKPLTGT